MRNKKGSKVLIIIGIIILICALVLVGTAISKSITTDLNSPQFDSLFSTVPKLMFLGIPLIFVGSVCILIGVSKNKMQSLVQQNKTEDEFINTVKNAVKSRVSKEKDACTCAYCGSYLKDGEHKCPYCGASKK